MKPPRPLGHSHTISPDTLVALGFILALWIATHPYIGVFQDARYYLVQTLHALDPPKWNQDLFFKYGTQDSFSLFSNGYRWLIVALGISHADLVATLIGDALWLSGLAALVMSVLKNPIERIAAASAVIALATNYGQFGSLNYAEPFVTPRLFAEAGVMIGLALALQRRYAWSAALFCFASAIHPLMAIPGVGIIAVDSLRRRRLAWLVLGLALFAGILGIWLGLEPFTRAKEFYDAQWLQIIESRNKFVLISEWSLADHARTISVLMVLGAFLSVANDRERKLTVILLTTTIAGCVAAFLGADAAHNVLMANLQLWRILWLATLVSNAAIFLLLLRSNGSKRAILAAGVALSFCSHFLISLKVVTPFATILCISWFLHGNLQTERIRFFVRAAILISLAVTFTMAAYALHIQFDVDPLLNQHLRSLTLATISAMGLAWCTRKPPIKWLVPTMICTLAIGTASADQRTVWTRYVYGPEPDGSLQQFLADAGTTYWEGGGVEILWFKAQKPDYYSCLQGSQAVFFRPQALEWSKRQSVLRPLNTEDFDHSPCGPKENPEANGPSSRDQIAAACRARPELDTIILNHPVNGLPTKSWTSQAYQEVLEHNPDNRNARGNLVKIYTFYRYSCADLRKSHPK